MLYDREYEIAQLVCCGELASRKEAQRLWKAGVADGVCAGKLGDEQRTSLAAADGCAESLAGAD